MDMSRDKAINAVRNAFILRGERTHTDEATPFEALISWSVAKNQIVDELAKECLLHSLTWADLKISGGAKVS